MVSHGRLADRRPPATGLGISAAGTRWRSGGSRRGHGGCRRADRFSPHLLGLEGLHLDCTDTGETWPHGVKLGKEDRAMRTHAEKASAFRALHDEPGTFIIPNPWDAGTARLLASFGFKALATTSLGLANSWGRGTVSADEIIENCRIIAAATDLPTNGDLENCGADEPEAAAEMIRRACEAGLVGGSIEDYTGDKANPIYGFNLAVERVYAAVEMARSLPIPFVLTARAENLIHGRLDLNDTIRRLQAFEQAGADVLYAPGLRDLE